MFTCEQIKEEIERNLEGSNVQVDDTRNDGEHFRAIVTWEGFKDKSLVEQHRIVYKAVDNIMKEGLHSLSLRTKVE